MIFNISNISYMYGVLQEPLVYFYFKEHPLFAENFADWLILDLLDEIIPDTLIHAFTSTDKLVCNH